MIPVTLEFSFHISQLEGMHIAEIVLEKAGSTFADRNKTMIVGTLNMKSTPTANELYDLWCALMRDAAHAVIRDFISSTKGTIVSFTEKTMAN